MGLLRRLFRRDDDWRDRLAHPDGGPGPAPRCIAFDAGRPDSPALYVEVRPDGTYKVLDLGRGRPTVRRHLLPRDFRLTWCCGRSLEELPDGDVVVPRLRVGEPVTCEDAEDW